MEQERAFKQSCSHYVINLCLNKAFADTEADPSSKSKETEKKVELAFAEALRMFLCYKDSRAPVLCANLPASLKARDIVYEPYGRRPTYVQCKNENQPSGAARMEKFITAIKEIMNDKNQSNADFIWAASHFCHDLKTDRSVFASADKKGLRLVLIGYRLQEGRMAGDLSDLSGMDYMCMVVTERRNEIIGAMIDDFHQRTTAPPPRQIVDPRLQFYMDMITNSSISDEIKMQLSNHYYLLVSRGLFPGGGTATLTSTSTGVFLPYGPEKVLDAPEMVKNAAAQATANQPGDLADLPPASSSLNLSLAELQTDPETDYRVDSAADLLSTHPVADLPLDDSVVEPPADQTLDSQAAPSSAVLPAHDTISGPFSKRIRKTPPRPNPCQEKVLSCAYALSQGTTDAFKWPKPLPDGFETKGSHGHNFNGCYRPKYDLKGYPLWLEKVDHATLVLLPSSTPYDQHGVLSRLTAAGLELAREIEEKNI
jgi:hypothetical protein